MNWSTENIEDAHSELLGAVSAQLERATEALGERADPASSVHEARRAIKRSRAILRLADPWPRNSRVDQTLRDAGRALALLRDADVLVLTAEDICEGHGPEGTNVVPSHMLASLEEERGRRLTESGAANGPLRRADDLLRAAASEVSRLRAPDLSAEPTASSGMELLRHGLRASYEAVRARSDLTTHEGREDERSHKLRKRVKDLRYQLEFLDAGQAKLGGLVKDLHHLTDLLGDRNDLAMLSAYTASNDVLSEIERAALIVHVEGLKQALRSEAATLSARLFEEPSDSFVTRIEAWVVAPQG